MQLTADVHLVGSGPMRLSNRYDCHVYLLVSGGEAALIDAGAGLEPDRISANVQALGLAPGAVRHLLLTHAHADHAGGVSALREQFHLQVVASAREARLLAEGTDEELGLALARREGVYPADYSLPRTTTDRLVSDGDAMQVGEYVVRALIRPGHSIGHTCYLAESPGQRLLFGGDLVFLKGLASVLNIPGCDLQQYRASARSLRGLAVDALFPGHGLWCLEKAQEHLDLAAARWDGIYVPPNYT
jgi:hydroxyacylglutathione hydrolase